MDINIDIDFCKQIKLVRHNEICTEIENLRNENFKAVVMMGQSAIKAVHSSGGPSDNDGIFQWKYRILVIWR